MHAQMLEHSLGFFEQEMKALFDFLIKQGYQVGLLVNGFSLMYPDQNVMPVKCLDLIHEALACNALQLQQNWRKLQEKGTGTSDCWKMVQEGMEREKMFLKLQKHLIAQLAMRERNCM